ncbi:unnamed protein product [Hermetia illucens]|uniref:NACHT domain-containing protein n=1 Tax=Hermetia illucens TaxID=343691 RepID=A0A7R8UXW8_HERIL|nr:uncharacterized protein LOC119655383 isoform X2 [Hermetia illucens]CAD7087984.1 unnamed protein product [Hermetia illucens]
MSHQIPLKRSKSESDNKEDFVNQTFDNKCIPSTGLKLAQHGVEYQLLLLSLCLWRVMGNNISDFLLATELPEAEKFDDVVIKYQHDYQSLLRFLQAKHKEAPRPTDAPDKITLADLLTPDETKEYSLLKYFRSFVKIQQKCSQDPVPAFLVGGNILDFILLTNIDLAEGLIVQYFEVDNVNCLEDDLVFGVPTQQVKKLKIKGLDNELTCELEVLLYTCSDFDELIENLADCLLFQQRFDGTSWIFKEYYYPLVKHVVEFRKEPNQATRYYGKFCDNFKIANSQRPAEINEFRGALTKEVAFRTSDYKVNILSSSGGGLLSQSDTNRKRKSSTDNSQLIKKLQQFADQLKFALYPANSIPPNKPGLTPALCKDEKLLKEVIDVKARKLCDDFVKGHKKLSQKAKLFRKILIDKVIDESIAEKEFEKVSDWIFPTTEGFANRFQPKSNPQMEDFGLFTEEIVDLIEKSTAHTIEITDVVGTDQFRKNIIELAGHAIVKVSTWFEFSGNFIRGRSLAKGPMKFRDALRKSLGRGRFHSIDEYRLNIKLKGFTSCEEAVLHRNLPSPVTSESIDDFYESFRLIVNYPNRYELRELLESEVKDKYRNLNSKAFVDSFVQEMNQWMAHRLGTFYTPKKAKTLLRRLDEGLSCYELDGISQSYYLALPNKYKFECNDLMESLLDFLRELSPGVLLLRIENLTLGRVRLMQAFWNLQERFQNMQSTDGELRFYFCQFGSLFMTIDHLLDESFCRKLSKRNEDKNQWNLRVVECWTECLPEAEKLGLMLDLLFERSTQFSVERKIIFIVKEDMSKKLESALASYFMLAKNTNFKFSSCAFKTNFKQLQISSQDELLKNGQVRLHERNCQLGAIVNQASVDLIDEATLAKLVSDRDGDSYSTCIGNVTQDFERTYDPDYYMPRYIKPVVIEIDSCKIPADTEEDSYYLLNKEREKGSDLLIVADSRGKFDEIRARLMESQDNSIPYSIHWVQEIYGPQSGKWWMWRDSIGSISNLKEYRKEQAKVSSHMEGEFLELVKDKKVVILHGIPGAGKSMLLANLFTQTIHISQSLWKIHINLNLYTDFFNERRKGAKHPTNMPPSECGEFLLRLLQSNGDSELKTQFEINLLRGVFRREGAGKIQLMLFLDGFDEISPTYKEIVLDFLQSSKNCSGIRQIFITTRPSFCQYLEENLQTFGFEMRYLTLDEQVQLLTLFIKKRNIHMEQKEVFSLIQDLSRAFIGREKFTAIPLHIEMFAEVCANMSREQIKICFKNCDPSTLYEMYFEMKYKLFREEKMRLNPTNVSGIEDYRYAYRDFLMRHEKLALWMIYSREEVMKIVRSFEEYEEEVLSLLDDIKAGKYKYGIVFGVSGKLPQFTHRTFAEYLVAHYFVRQTTGVSRLRPNTVDFIVVQMIGDIIHPYRIFFDSMMSKKHWKLDKDQDLEGVSGPAILNALVESYKKEEWGIFSFVSQFVKNDCFYKVLDICMKAIEECFNDRSYFALFAFLVKWRTKLVRLSPKGRAIMKLFEKNEFI